MGACVWLSPLATCTCSISYTPAQSGKSFHALLSVASRTPLGSMWNRKLPRCKTIIKLVMHRGANIALVGQQVIVLLSASCNKKGASSSCSWTCLRKTSICTFGLCMSHMNTPANTHHSNSHRTHRRHTLLITHAACVVLIIHATCECCRWCRAQHVCFTPCLTRG